MNIEIHRKMLKQEIEAERQKVLDEVERIVDNLYHKLTEHEVWGVGGDIVCHNCEEYIKEKIQSLRGDEK